MVDVVAEAMVVETAEEVIVVVDNMRVEEDESTMVSVIVEVEEATTEVTEMMLGVLLVLPSLSELS